MVATERLAALRQVFAEGEGRALTWVPLGHGPADSVLHGGLAKGALHEVFAFDARHGAAASGFAAALAARVAETKSLLWVRQDFSALEHGELSAMGLLDLGIAPQRVILLRAADA